MYVGLFPVESQDVVFLLRISVGPQRSRLSCFMGSPQVDDCAGDTRAWTALFYAADDANTEAMETLLTQPTEKKANPNHRDTKGNTPLHVVCKTEWLNFNDQLEMVNLLLDNGVLVYPCVG